MSGAQFLDLATNAGLVILTLAMVLIIVRIVRGPTLPDRVLALDTLTVIGIAFIAVVAIRTGHMLYLDIAISIGLVGFLATIAFARYVLGRREDAMEHERSAGGGPG